MTRQRRSKATLSLSLTHIHTLTHSPSHFPKSRHSPAHSCDNEKQAKLLLKSHTHTHPHTHTHTHTPTLTPTHSHSQTHIHKNQRCIIFLLVVKWWLLYSQFCWGVMYERRKKRKCLKTKRQKEILNGQTVM